jgi:Replicase family
MIAEQLELFQSRLPSKPYCADILANGLMVRPRKTATQKRYIQANPPWLRSWLIFDIDRADAAVAWDDAHLPEPFWTSQNPKNGHAHLCYGLDAPVLLGHHDRQRPMRYLAAVETAMRAKLEADPGYSGLITKNPMHKSWRTFWHPVGGLYCLDDLSEWLELPKYINKRDKPERVGIGRNVDTFDHLRKVRAYPNVLKWKGRKEHGVFVRWIAWLYEMAQQHTHENHGSPLDYRECHHIAKSVGTWTWKNFSEAERSEWARMKGRAGGKAKGAAYEDRRISARLMKAKGHSYSEVAAELGVSRRAVIGWCK